MKQIMFVIGFLLGSFLLFTSFSLRENPQNPPRGEKGDKTKRHIRLEKIENGEKTVLDTVIEGNRVFVWNGDTIGSASDLKWIGKDVFQMDSIHKNFEFRFLESDWPGDKRFLFAPEPPNAPKIPHVVRLQRNLRGNAIDLNDPGIISYKKKKLRGGREKITIIRNEPSEKGIEKDVLITVPDAVGPALWMGADGPEKRRTIKIQKNNDDEFDVIENEDVKIQKEDGKVIIIRKKIKGNTEDVEIEMEENDMPENN